MSDLIDRAKLLKVLEERKKPNNGGEDGTKERFRYMQWLMDYNTVKEAPTAEIELPIKQKCTICPHCDNCDVNDDGTIEPMSDLIDRQEAIDAIEPTLKSILQGNSFKAINVIDKIRDLPSAEPEPIRINLNEPIKVKLTDWGKEIYYHQYDRTNQIAGREICKPRFPKEDENGYTEFQLWCFMELYGEYIGMTLPNVIEPLEIVYEEANRNDD